ncbi:MAG: hypothetical protein JRJ85_21700 [Deltaproteobacteria bacterium]|nr:hypothetical protein [Deltaproteobacteria bacterium]
MLKRKLLALLVMLPALVFIMSCAGVSQLMKTTEGQYLVALKNFNDLVEDYNAQYRLQPAPVQADWKAEIDPWIKKTYQALDAWGTAVDAGASAEAKIEVFNALKVVLITTLIQEGIIKTK